MKAKYKLQTLVEFNNGVHGATGSVTAIISRQHGFSYEISNFDEEVSEEQITKAYRPVNPRKPKEEKKAKESKVAAKKA